MVKSFCQYTLEARSEVALHSSRIRRLQEAKHADQYQHAMEFIRRHSPCEHERSRGRSIDAIAVEHRGDIDRKQGVLVHKVVDLGAKLTRNLEEAAFELLVDFRFGAGLDCRKWLFGVLDTPARASGGRHLWKVSASVRGICV